jgi:four helix bundle protein
MPDRLDHERRIVYQRSLEFVRWTGTALQRIPARTSARDQLDRASTSIPLNIAEGNGRHSASDRCRFLDIARGSALESAAILDVLVARGILSDSEVENPKGQLAEMVSMLVGLIRSQSPDRMQEAPTRYGADRGWGEGE